MATEKTPNYTPAQEDRIRAFMADNGANKASAELLAVELGKSLRSVIAKAVRMEIGYAKATPTTKSGDPVVSKADLVADISAIVDGNLTGLENAPKAALFALRAFARG